jgi:hypothetical protein
MLHTSHQELHRHDNSGLSYNTSSESPLWPLLSSLSFPSDKVRKLFNGHNLIQIRPAAIILDSLGIPINNRKALPERCDLFGKIVG